MDLKLDLFIDKPTVWPPNMSSISDSPIKRRLANSNRAGYISKINMENRKGESQCKKQVPNRFIE
jgi:hypothetical protein